MFHANFAGGNGRDRTGRGVIYRGMAPFQILTVKLARSVALSEYTKHLEFEVVAGPCFGFVPGQWLSLKQNKPDGEEITRAYSIASPPDGNRFALCLNRVPDGFMSSYLCGLQVGTEISAQGPFGSFILRPLLRDSIFIATGTGIAPYRSMLQWLFADSSRHQGKRFWLVFGAVSRRTSTITMSFFAWRPSTRTLSTCRP